MMAKRSKMVAVPLMAAAILASAGCEDSTSSAANEHVLAEIGEHRITAQEVESVLQNRYYDVVIDDLIDSKLLELKAKELNVEVPEPDTSLNPEQAALQRRNFLLQGILMQTVEDSKIQNYYEDNKQVLKAEAQLEATLFKIDHQVATKFLSAHASGQGVERIMKEFNIQPNQIEKKRISGNDPLVHQLESLSIGEATMVMTGSDHYVAILEDKKEGEALVSAGQTSNRKTISVVERWEGTDPIAGQVTSAVWGDEAYG